MPDRGDRQQQCFEAADIIFVNRNMATMSTVVILNYMSTVGILNYMSTVGILKYITL